MPIFFIQFEGTPQKNTRVSPESGGGFINCWIDRPDVEAAIEYARRVVQSEGWIVDDPDDAYKVDESHYPKGKSGRKYFREALREGQAFCFYVYPASEENAD